MTTTREAKSKSSIYFFDPEQLTRVTDQDHELWDPRVEEGPDPALVDSVLKFGIRRPIVVSQQGDLLLVADGRRRHRAAMEAKRRQVEAGEEVTIRIPCIYSKIRAGSEMILQNEHHKEESILQKARKAQRAMALGQSLPEVAALFGRDQKTIKNWLAILQAPPEEIKAIEQGEQAASEALPQKKRIREGVRAPSNAIPKAAQRAALASLTEVEKPTTNHQLAAAILSYLLGEKGIATLRPWGLEDAFK